MFKYLCCGMFSENKKVTPKIAYVEKVTKPPRIMISGPTPVDDGELGERGQRVMRCLGVRGQFFTYGSTFSHNSFNFKKAYFHVREGDTQTVGVKHVFN